MLAGLELGGWPRREDRRPALGRHRLVAQTSARRLRRAWGARPGSGRHMAGPFALANRLAVCGVPSHARDDRSSDAPRLPAHGSTPTVTPPTPDAYAPTPTNPGRSTAPPPEAWSTPCWGGVAASARSGVGYGLVDRCGATPDRPKGVRQWQP